MRIREEREERLERKGGSERVAGSPTYSVLTSEEREKVHKRMREKLGKGERKKERGRGQAPYPRSAKRKVYCQTQQDRINVNLPPSFNNNGEENLIDPCPLVQPYHYEENPRNIVHPTQLQHCDPNSNHNNGVYHVPFDSATSVSGFKSWLRQAPFCSEKSSCEATNNCDFQSLSLTMSPNSKAGMSTALSPLQAVENRKCSAGKSHAREPVPRKSIDTFEQRTSQYHGVTRYHT
ncbi:hypothetical protein L1049_011112 [Liquidambar formosana]|uniref:Uncharacterized protein n=1 Tax=Liquidambar formosana TaxID=63359 RepID=A0AAP0RUU1_LIQFO